MPTTPLVRPVAVLGDRNEHVLHLQTQLRDKAFYTLTADGVFNDFTDTSVRYFQRSRRLLQDGIVGPLTWAAIEALG